MTSEIAPAVVFIFISPDKNILLEKRPAKGSYPEEWIFPGGKVEPGETVTESLLREIGEELQVKPIIYHPLLLLEKILSPMGRVVHPFIVLEWEGEIPPTVFDTGNPLRWGLLTETAQSPVEHIRLLTKYLNNFLNNNGTH